MDDKYARWRHQAQHELYRPPRAQMMAASAESEAILALAMRIHEELRDIASIDESTVLSLCKDLEWKQARLASAVMSATSRGRDDGEG